VPFNINAVKILSTVYLDEDAQLAAFGLVNKVLDYMLDFALEHAVSVILTIWMACSSHFLSPKIYIS